MAFSAADVKNLREMTGVGMMDCKKALTAADGDIDKAVEWLREKGLAAAQKKADFKEAGIEYTIKQIDEYRACRSEEGRPHRRRGHGLRRRRRWYRRDRRGQRGV